MKSLLRIILIGQMALAVQICQAQVDLIVDDFSASVISTNGRIRTDQAGLGWYTDNNPTSDWIIGSGIMSNAGTTPDGSASEGALSQVIATDSLPDTLTGLTLSFDYTVGATSTLKFALVGYTENLRDGSSANNLLMNNGTANGNLQNDTQAELRNGDMNLLTGADMTQSITSDLSFASGTSGSHSITVDVSAYSWNADEAADADPTNSPGLSGSIASIADFDYVVLVVVNDLSADAGATATTLDNVTLSAVVAPPATPTRFTRIDLDGSNNSLVNGSYEDVTQISGTSVSGQVEFSNSSFDNTDGDVYSVTQWSPADDDPNNMVGQYGDAGTVTTNSFYLDTNSIATATGPTVGTRGILMNSANGYVNKLVNEDILTALSLDPKLLSPHVQIKVTADVNRRNDNTGGNDTATATFAITAGSTDPDDVANAIAGGTASVAQDSILVLAPEQLELNLTGADFDTASQLNLVIQSVNSATLGAESTVGQDLTQTSQVVFDNIIFTAFLPGDNDGDFDVELADLDQYIGNIGADGTAALLLLDLDGDGIVGANDFAQHYTELVETSNGGKGTFAGDANLDGVVNVLEDAFILVGNLGSAATSWSQGDFNGDGTVDVLGDAFALVGNLGQDNGGATAP